MMLLCELTGMKRFYKYTQSELFKILRRMGVLVTSGGSYGTILTSDKWMHVVKMFADDPYYLSFVKFATTHPNKHYPKFGRMPLQMHVFYRRFSNDSNTMWLLKIEKLQELDRNTALFIVDKIEFCQTIAYWLATETSKAGSTESLDRVDTDRYTPGMRYLDGSSKKVSVRQWAKDHEWLIQLASAWQAIMEGEIEGAPDLHKGNFMQRADGTVVIIDPLWEGSSPYKEYDAWYRTMTDADNGGDTGEDEPTTQGPKYAYQVRKEREARENAKTRPPAQHSDDDIPF